MKPGSTENSSLSFNALLTEWVESVWWKEGWFVVRDGVLIFVSDECYLCEWILCSEICVRWISLYPIMKTHEKYSHNIYHENT